MFDFNRAVCRVTLTWFFAEVRVRESDDVELAKCPKPWPFVPNPAKASPCSGSPLPSPRAWAPHEHGGWSSTSAVYRTFPGIVDRTRSHRHPNRLCPIARHRPIDRIGPRRTGTCSGGSSYRRLPDNATYPAQLKQIYDRPLVLYVRGNVGCVRSSRGSQSWARAIPHLTGWAWPSGWHAISRTAAW